MFSKAKSEAISATRKVTEYEDIQDNYTLAMPSLDFSITISHVKNLLKHTSTAVPSMTINIFNSEKPARLKTYCLSCRPLSLYLSCSTDTAGLSGSRTAVMQLTLAMVGASATESSLTRGGGPSSSAI